MASVDETTRVGNRIDARIAQKVIVTDESFHDSNNNQDDQNLGGISARSLPDQQNTLVNGSTPEAASSTGSLEDWQILDADEQDLNTAEMPHNDRLLGNRGQYTEIGPDDRTLASPVMIHLCTAIYSLMPLASACACLMLVGLLCTRYYLLTLIYGAYIFLDRHTCNQGGRRLSFVFESKFWSYLAAYFPIRVRHSTEFRLDATKNYILNYHPHGISAFGAVTAFATNGMNLRRSFPGITTRFMVHETSFVMPVMRETFAFRGDCSVNSRSIDYILSGRHANHESGNLLTIVVGGLAEADLSDPDTLKVVVAERKGFVKKALIHGANLVPCIAFGENSVFTKVNHEPNSLMHRLESLWYSLFKFKHPIYYGRSLVSEKLRGVMPHRRPITLVMGDPIEVIKSPTPSQEEIDALHSTYVANLRSLYAGNRDLCSKFDTKLEIV